jgi:hypothetical protein
MILVTSRNQEELEEYSLAITGHLTLRSTDRARPRSLVGRRYILYCSGFCVQKEGGTKSKLDCVRDDELITMQTVYILAFADFLNREYGVRV